MNRTSQQERNQLLARRVSWLADNPILWLKVKKTKEVKRRLIEVMKQIGLFAPTTHWGDVRFDRLFRKAKSLIECRHELGNTH